LDDNFAEPNLDGGIISIFDFRLANIFWWWQSMFHWSAWVTFFSSTIVSSNWG